MSSREKIRALLPERPSLLDDLDLRRHAVIEASAGTGKTHTLEHLVIELLLSGTPIDRILVVTFTEKAALEMRARIRSRIASLVAGGCRELAPALIDFDRAPISTIHAFCQRVLAEHAFVSGRLLEEQRLDAREAFGAVLREALRRGLGPKSEHRILLECTLASLGPARLEESLWRWSREPGEVRPHFDVDAVKTALVAMATPSELEDVRGRSLLARIEHPATKARARDALTLLGRLALRARMGATIDELLPELFEWAAAVPHPRAEPNASFLASRLGSDPDIGRHAIVLASALSTPMLALVHRFLPALMQSLEERKRASGRFDFDDLLVLVQRAVHGEGSEPLVAALRARYRYALVDEFQDTDPIQWSIFRRVFFEAGPSAENANVLFLIGDPKQSIYSFRSADVHTYLAACDEIVASGGTKVALIDCYRSTAPMIDALNTLFERDFFTGPNSYSSPVRCARPELKANDRQGKSIAPVCLFHLVAKDKLRAKPLRFALARAIASEIEVLLDGGMHVSDRTRPTMRPLAPSDIFVLTRTTREAIEVADALRRRAIPHALFKQDGLFDAAEARDVLDVLAALARPGSRSHRLRAWLTPFFGLALDQLESANDLPLDHPFVERLMRWSTLAREHRFAALFSAMLDESGLSRRLLFLREGERELVNYAHLLELLLARAHQGRLGLRELILHLSTWIEVGAGSQGDDADVQRLESERAAIQILTMHKSKGLEAEVVFLFGGMTRRPSSIDEPKVLHEDRKRIACLGVPSHDDAMRIEQEERQEQERLLYVALTRARSRLYLPYVGEAPSGAVLPLGMTSNFGKLGGAYRVLCDRLVGLCRQGVIDAGEDGALFGRRTITVTGDRSKIVIPPPLPEIDRTLMSSVSRPAPMDAGHFEALRAASRGMSITSYTRMKSEQGKSFEVGPSLDDPSSWIEEMARDVTPAVQDDDEALPAGAAFGVFIHEVLESITMDVARTADSGATLWADPKIKKLIEDCGERNGIDASFFLASAEMVWRALRTPISVEGSIALPRGLAEVDRMVREMSFLHPIPERTHAAFGVLQTESMQVERGFVRGVIDVVFEHDGKTFLIDWKTDRLAGYDRVGLIEHARTHYDVQARLYALGMARALGIKDAADHQARFGGILYLFLRGMRARGRGQDGIYFTKPTFDELIEWDRALREEPMPFGCRLPPARRPFSPVMEGGS